MARRYKCPYCDDKYERKDLIEHIDKKHEDLIPENFTSTRVVFNLINKRECGYCRVCNKETKWREDLQRYDVLCDNPKCKETLRKRYQENMIRVRGTDNILNDPEQQKKMLANRSISGKYKFTDGGILTYTGSYEKKCLEFMDKVLEIPSKDILSPGPTLEYEMNGEKHFYITDFYLIPQNLIIEVKDGGDNLNTKDTPGMRSSRERTLAKEKLITESGEYNYVRLTNNDFAQLIDVLMEIKKAQFGKIDGKIIKVNESYITEADEDTLEKIKKFNKELCTYEYIIVKPNGEVITKIKQDDFKNYNILSPSKFKRYRGGICWDYVVYENANFPNVKHKTFFFCMVDKDGNPKHTHTFLLFYLNDKTYWFESSWKSNMGIFEFNNEDEALSFIINKLSSAQSDKGDYYVVDYKPNKYIGMSENEFLESMSKLLEYNYKTVKNPSHNIIQSIKVKNGKIVESVVNEVFRGTPMKSDLDPNFIPKEKFYLNDFTKKKIDKVFLNKYKSRYKTLKHVDPKNNGYVWIDDDKVVGYCSVDMDKELPWITALEVTEEYKGHGLGEQLLDYAVNELGGQALTVAKDNMIAKRMYDNYGFKVSKTSQEKADAGESAALFMYLDPSKSYLVESVIEESSNMVYRVTYNGEGIYEALRKNVDFNTWKSILSSNKVNWLPKPPEYINGYKSYFTEYGYKKFCKLTLPLIAKYLDKDKITIMEYNIEGEVVYSDKYQIVIDDSAVSLNESDIEYLNNYIL